MPRSKSTRQPSMAISDPVVTFGSGKRSTGMRFLLFNILITGFLAAAGQQPVLYFHPASPEFASRRLSRKEVAGDLRYWQETMEKVHPQLYHSISKDSLTALRERLIHQLPDSITHQRALLIFGQMAGALDEGHIMLPRSEVTDSLYIARYKRLPLSFSSFTESELVVDADWSREQVLPAGSRLLSINGKSAAELHARFLPCFGGFAHWKDQLIATFARKLLFLHDINPPYQVIALTPANDTISFTTEGLDRKAIDSLNNSLRNNNPAATAPFTLSIGDDQVALIVFNSMNRQFADSFRRFLQHSFSLIRENNCKGVIVDIRQNSGGSSTVGEMLISYISDQPYQTAAGTKWKVSEPYKEFLRLSNTENDNYLKETNGSFLTYRNKRLSTPPANPLRFRGKVALLIGPNTFSSANMIADGIKTYHLAKVFGQAAGESGNDFGEIFPFMLPATQIIMTATTKMFIRASGDETDFSPTQPDVEVKPVMGRDAPLEAAKKWILE